MRRGSDDPGSLWSPHADPGGPRLTGANESEHVTASGEDEHRIYIDAFLRLLPQCTEDELTEVLDAVWIEYRKRADPDPER
jgi:hypothetical protein